jgi:hypothetical protein
VTIVLSSAIWAIAVAQIILDLNDASPLVGNALAAASWSMFLVCFWVHEMRDKSSESPVLRGRASPQSAIFCILFLGFAALKVHADLRRTQTTASILAIVTFSLSACVCTLVSGRASSPQAAEQAAPDASKSAADVLGAPLLGGDAQVVAAAWAAESTNANPIDNANPVDSVSLWSLLMFSYISSFMSWGSAVEGKFEIKDLWPLETQDTAAVVNAALSQAWEKEKDKDALIVTALRRAFGGDFWLAGFFQLINNLIVFANPLLLNRLLEFLEPCDESDEDCIEEPDSNGYYYVAGFVLVGLIASVSIEQSYIFGWRAGFHCRASLINLVFSKSLRVDLGSISQASVDEGNDLDAQEKLLLPAGNNAEAADGGRNHSKLTTNRTVSSNNAEMDALLAARASEASAHGGPAGGEKDDQSITTTGSIVNLQSVVLIFPPAISC